MLSTVLLSSSSQRYLMLPSCEYWRSAMSTGTLLYDRKQFAHSSTWVARAIGDCVQTQMFVVMDYLILWTPLKVATNHRYIDTYYGHIPRKMRDPIGTEDRNCFSRRGACKELFLMYAIVSAPVHHWIHQ